MQFGKRVLFLALNGIFAVVLLLYFIAWWMGSTTQAIIKRPYQASIIAIEYNVAGKAYGTTLLRSDIPFRQNRVEVRYWPWWPAVVRVNSFMGIAAEPLAWWAVFLLASAMLLLTNNTVFSRGTRFQLHKGFPWITMDEYFPAAGPSFHAHEPGKKKKQHRLTGNKATPRL